MPTATAPDASTSRLTPYVRYHKDIALAAGLVAASMGLLLLFRLFPGLQFTLQPPWGVTLHTLFGTSSVVLSVLIFAAGLYGFKRERSSNVALMCNVFLAVAILDFVHMLSFDGMPDLVTPSGNGKSLSFLLAARLLVAVTMLAIALLPWQGRIDRAVRVALLVLSLAYALGIGAYGLYAPELASLFFQVGSGPTALKVALEYGVVLLNLAAAAAFYLRMRAPQPYPLGPFFTAACLMALSEFCLTIYSSASDQYSLMAHVLRLAAYVFVYRATFVEMLDAPYRQLERARSELIESEEKYRLLFENAPDAYLIANADGSFHAANPAASTLFRIPRQDLWRIGRNDVTSDPRLAAFLEERSRTGFARGELILRRGDGSTFLGELTSTMYTDSRGRQMGTTFIRDITEKRQADEEILRLNATLEKRVRERTAELEEANRDLQRFTHVLAHELRSPLVAIEGFGGLLKSSTSGLLDDKQERYIGRIRSNTGRMAQMIDDLLELADVARSPLKIQPLDLSAIANEVLASREGREPGRSVKTVVQPGMTLAGDARMVTLMMSHLMDSAWTHTVRNPEAEIAVETEPGADGAMVYVVRDNGAGGPALTGKVLDRLGIWQSAGDAAPGGIMMAAVRRIVARHGGRIWAEALPGGGLAVRFCLDRAA
ncbi:MAG: MASE3 domain-containing protein [Acidovorax sp.]|nr:MASE3 domain-containing protein [Acidovorax sp.]